MKFSEWIYTTHDNRKCCNLRKDDGTDIGTVYITFRSEFINENKDLETIYDLSVYFIGGPQFSKENISCSNKDYYNSIFYKAEQWTLAMYQEYIDVKNKINNGYDVIFDIINGEGSHETQRKNG